MTDISDTLTPKSDQLDAVDLLDGPREFTITKVDVRPTAEQPVTVHLAEFPRPWKPGKNMRRVLAYCLGNDSSKWIGQRVVLFYDGSVAYAGQEVGGVRISHLSGISGVKKAPIIPTRGKAATWTVQPLRDAPTPPPTDGDTDARVTALRQEWKTADDARKAEIQAEVQRLTAGGES